MISVNRILYTLLCLFALVNYFFPTEITFIVALIGVGFSFWGRGFTQGHIQSLIYPLLLLGFGFINSYNNEIEFVFKDFYYFFNPLIIFSFGYVCAYYISVDKFLKTCIWLGIALGVVYLINHDWGGNSSVNALHQEEGVASYMVLLALVFLSIKNFRNERLFSKNINWLFIFILSLACIVALSRTFLLIFITLIITGTGQLKFEKYFILKSLVLVMFLGVGVYLLMNAGSADHSSFLGKLLYSMEEVKISDYDDIGEINNNWRGFEAYMGWQQINKGNLFEWVFGQGFGTNTPIGIEIMLGGEYFTEIPYFHNGYITIILKTGFVGLLIYLAFLGRMSITNLKEEYIYSEDYEISKNIITGLAITILLTTFIISGWLNKSTLAPVIFSLGYFIGAKNNIKNFYLSDNLEDD